MLWARHGQIYNRQPCQIYQSRVGVGHDIRGSVDIRLIWALLQVLVEI
jgi:hypothetical protein